VMVACIGLIGVLTFIANHIRKKKGKDNLWADIIEAFATGVSDAQEEIVRDAKKASEDGKLDKKERKQAVEHALGIAKGVATGAAGRAIAKMGIAEGRKWIGRILAGRKKSQADIAVKKAEAKANEVKAALGG